MKSIDKELKPEKEILVQELMELVFEKAYNEARRSSTNGIATHLYETILDHFNISIDILTFRRYYKSYIKKESKKNVPNNDTLDVLCNYLGFKNWKDFAENSTCEIAKKKLRRKASFLKAKYKRFMILSLAIITLLSLGIMGITLKYYKKNCMVWVDDHYEKVRCSGLKYEQALDSKTLQKFQRANVEDFMNSNKALWYDKYKNEIEFFTYHGEHPMNGRTLKPVTSHIREKYLSANKDLHQLNSTDTLMIVNNEAKMSKDSIK